MLLESFQNNAVEVDLRAERDLFDFDLEDVLVSDLHGDWPVIHLGGLAIRN